MERFLWVTMEFNSRNSDRATAWASYQRALSMGWDAEWVEGWADERACWTISVYKTL